jgi:hypothetical protein
MLFVGDRSGGDAKDFCEQLMMVADALVLPVDFLGWIVEGVCSTSVYLMQGWLITRGLAGGGIVPSVTYG